jgi:hypothetical protein
VLSLRLADGSGSERFALSFQPALPLREAL